LTSSRVVLAPLGCALLLPQLAFSAATQAGSNDPMLARRYSPASVSARAAVEQ
jgi:hypothetical protein